jgi:hypothetical protein
VATLVKQQGDAYTANGQRSEVRVYFNGGTVPGDTNRVYLEWTEDVIDTPYRDGASSPQEARDLGAKYRDDVISNHIEFYELMTPEKMQAD